jgi:branched-chain amino acid transport system ATP-binding protein
MSLLEVDGLSVSYGASAALRDVSLNVEEGSVVGILGANGAGKSTLLRTIAGLVHPQAGEIRYRGARIEGHRANTIARRGVCLIPEGRGILPTLTVADNMKIASARDRATAARAYGRFPVLRERGEQRSGTLSGGEQQMLAFARAFDDNARMLLVDEPSL